jgi:hypothetical protein
MRQLRNARVKCDPKPARDPFRHRFEESLTAFRAESAFTLFFLAASMESYSFCVTTRNGPGGGAALPMSGGGALLVSVGGGGAALLPHAIWSTASRTTPIPLIFTRMTISSS